MDKVHVECFESKNPDTVTGAIIIIHSDLELHKLPKLRGDWYWEVQLVTCDCEEE